MIALCICIKYQLRQGLFLIPVIILPVLLFTKSYLFVFFILQTRFYKVFQQNDFPLQLLQVTGTDLGTLLKAYNLSWAVWLNAWLVVSQIINLIFYDTTFLTTVTQQVHFNILLFIGFILGNNISNSDLITVKNSILKFLGMSFLFGTCISITAMVLQISSFLNQSFLISVFLLSGIIYTWNYLIKQQHNIKYISYYL